MPEDIFQLIYRQMYYPKYNKRHHTHFFVRDAPIKPYEIINFQKRHNITFPPQIQDYFYRLNGIIDGFRDLYALTEWMPFLDYQYLYPMDQKYFPKPLENYYLMGHYDISVWYWLIELHPDPTVPTPVTCFLANSDTPKTEVMAQDFSEFLHRWYTEDPESLLTG